MNIDIVDLVRKSEFYANDPHVFIQQLDSHIAKVELKATKRNRDSLIDKLPSELIEKTHGWCPLYYQNAIPDLFRYANLSLLPSLDYCSFDKTSLNLTDVSLLDHWGLDE